MQYAFTVGPAPPGPGTWELLNDVAPSNIRLNGMFQKAFEGLSSHGYAIFDGATVVPNSSDEAGKILQRYGMGKVATVQIEPGGRLVISRSNSEVMGRPKCIYAFVMGGWIGRIGSSKGVLQDRMKATERHITDRWQNPAGKSPAPLWEAILWREALIAAGTGAVYAREGTKVTTPIGVISTYLDEESEIIGCHKPPLNRSLHR